MVTWSKFGWLATHHKSTISSQLSTSSSPSLPLGFWLPCTAALHSQQCQWGWAEIESWAFSILSYLRASILSNTDSTTIIAKDYLNPCPMASHPIATAQSHSQPCCLALYQPCFPPEGFCCFLPPATVEVSLAWPYGSQLRPCAPFSTSHMAFSRCSEAPWSLLRRLCMTWRSSRLVVDTQRGSVSQKSPD